jgi:proteasome lid subunit RPN8/RPN11
MHDHALQEYPYECCGIITVVEDRQAVYPCTNIQNRLHAEDPSRYPRDGRIAYTIDREEFDRIITESRQRGETVLAFYHSHPDHEAFFSQEDHAAQTALGEPEFPDALQVVISVESRQIRDTKVFRWDSASRTFAMTDMG